MIVGGMRVSQLYPDQAYDGKSGGSFLNISKTPLLIRLLIVNQLIIPLVRIYVFSKH